jgi:Arc/MetJ-type ribon-helix-helix transcriptional regulator
MNKFSRLTTLFATRPNSFDSGRLFYTGRMEVRLTGDQKAFVRQAIETGRYAREEEAVQEALSLWEERERTRAEILAQVDLAEASLARGEGRIITRESMRALAGEVKQRGRARLAGEQPENHRPSAL